MENMESKLPKKLSVYYHKQIRQRRSDISSALQQIYGFMGNVVFILKTTNMNQNGAVRYFIAM